MANILTRVSGKVLRLDERSGVKDGSPWAMSIATILLGTHGTSEVVLPREADRAKLIGKTPVRGDDVDWVVEIRNNGANRLNTNVLGSFTDELL